MGLFDGLGSSVIGSFISGIFGSRQQKRNLQAQQRENSLAREFNAQQAALTRQFNSAEAEKSRQFEERMYQLYESPIAQAQQRQQAGLPMEATSMSVGSSSTASASPASTSPSSLPAPPSPWSDLGESIKQLPFIRQQIRAAVLDNQQRELEQEKTRAETFKTWQEGYQTQIENGFTAEEKRAIIDDLIASKDKKGSDKKLIDQQIEFIENAKDAGINPVVDAHNETLARIAKVQQEIENLKVDNEAKSFALETSKLYDRKFLALDYEERKKAVEEFLDTSDVRVSLYNAQKGFARLAMNAAERADALESITNETEKIIAQSILDAAEDGVSSLDAVMLKYLTDDPASTLSALSAILKPPSIVTKHYY